MSFLQFNNKIFFIIAFMGIFLYSLIMTIATDYSWLINVIDYYTYDEIFYNSAFDTYGGWGTFFIYLNSKIVSLFGNFYLNYWLIGLLYSIIAIILFFKFLKEKYLDNDKAKLAILVYVLLTFFTGIFIGTRPENIYVSSIAILLFTLYKFDRTNNYIWIYISTFVSIFGALSHPNGLVLFVIMFIFAIKLIIDKKISYIHLSINILILSILFYNGLLFEQTLDELILSIKAIATDQGHTIPFYYEVKRYIGFIFVHELEAPIFVFVLYTTFIYIKKYILNKKDFFNNFIAICIVFIFIYLLFLGAKWEYYLALFFPFMTITFIEYIKNKKFNVNLCITLFISIMFIHILKDFKKNEEFLNAIHAPSQRVNIINNIKKELISKKVYAPMRLYVMLKDYKNFVPLENNNIKNKKFDYIVLDFGRKVLDFDKKLNTQLIYKKSFIYNGVVYNLFKVKY